MEEEEEEEVTSEIEHAKMVLEREAKQMGLESLENIPRSPYKYGPCLTHS